MGEGRDGGLRSFWGSLLRILRMHTFSQVSALGPGTQVEVYFEIRCLGFRLGWLVAGPIH